LPRTISFAQRFPGALKKSLIGPEILAFAAVILMGLAEPVETSARTQGQRNRRSHPKERDRPMLNPTLRLADMPADVRAAFGDDDPKIVTLPPQFRLFKLTQYSLMNPKAQVPGPKGPEFDINQKLSHWWSPVMPYLDDNLGALGRYLEAKANNVTMQEMVRFAAAVSLDWNDLDNYQEVVTLDHIQCFWGTHSPQRMLSDNPKGWQAALNKADQRGAYVPDTLGGIDTAWQFWIPNLTIQYVEERATIPAHDMAALAAHLNR
jgi:hypothetical protein